MGGYCGTRQHRVQQQQKVRDIPQFANSAISKESHHCFADTEPIAHYSSLSVQREQEHLRQDGKAETAVGHRRIRRPADVRE
jgi:hypothetical protein